MFASAALALSEQRPVAVRFCFSSLDLPSGATERLLFEEGGQGVGR